MYDIAVVTLSTPVPPTYLSYGLDISPLTAGTTLTLVGYGATGDGVHGYDSSIRKAGAWARTMPTASCCRAGRASPQRTNRATVTYLFDFDSPDSSAPNFLGGGSLGNTVETTIGTGDSGSPAFRLIHGQYEIAATTNLLLQFSQNNPYGTFGSGGGGAIVSAYQTFLQSVVPAQFSPLTLSGIVTLQAVLAGATPPALVFTLTRPARRRETHSAGAFPRRRRLLDAGQCAVGHVHAGH